METDRSSNYSDDNGRDTPKEGFDLPLRADTPGPMPEYIYSKSKLLDLEVCAASKIRPSCLSKEFDTPDGFWDPERWFRSFDSSPGSSPLTLGDRKRPSDLDKDYLMRRRPSDPKERLKEERDGIVLSPQRRSFGTGCHVSTNHMSLGRQISVPGQESTDRDRDRGSGRRIGSGRIQIDRDGNRDRNDYRERDNNRDRNDFRDSRERNDRDFNQGKAEASRERNDRDFRDLRDRGDRDFRDQRDRGDRNERDFRDRGERDFRAIKDRFDERDRRFDRDNRGFGRREYDERRDYNDRGGYGYRNRRDSYNRHREEDEPEWFTEGPTSRRDTIELHGFDKSDKRRSRTPNEGEENVREKTVTRREQNAPRKLSIGHQEEVDMESKSVEMRNKAEVPDECHTCQEEDDKMDFEPTNAGVAKVADRNGSLETNDPSSPEECNTSDSINNPSPQSHMFDFNEFFKIENIPGLHGDTASPTAELTSGIQSRFSKWFASNSRENSRRSSINEDFGYLNDLLSGSKSPVIPSPPPPSANSLFNQSVFSTSANSTFADKPQHHSFDFSSIQKSTIGPMLNAIFQNSQAVHDKAHRSSPNSMSAQDAEAQLKALLFGRKGSTPSSSGTGSPAVASPLNLPGKVKTLAEIEADMKPPPQNKSLPQMGPQGPIRHSISEQHPVLPPQRRPSPQQQTLSRARPLTPKEHQDEDLKAFNKLLSLMKAGAAAAVESPKLPINVSRPDQRPVSPHMTHAPPPGAGPPPMVPPPNGPVSPSSHNEFIQAILRNKEQQRQIREQTLNQMRTHVTKQSTPFSTPPSIRSQTSLQQQHSVTGQAMYAANQPHGQPIMGLLQNTSTPRAPSPSSLVTQTLLQQPSSPRVPSPIMFSQQPPMHISAPSPIHPSQVGGATTPVSMPSATTLSSSNTIRPPSVPRVPSPQELIAHTQAIMQTALLKKQLEDQKERFIKKQQERGKSPNPMGPSPQPGQMQQKSPVPSSAIGMGGIPPGVSMGVVPNMGAAPPGVSLGGAPAGVNMSVPPPISSSAQPKGSVPQTFTPTSVMRKMHSDKHDKAEKLKQDSVDDDMGSPAVQPPVKQLVKQEKAMEDKDQKTSDDGQAKADEQIPANQRSNVPVMPMWTPNTSMGGGKPATGPHGMVQNMSVPPPPLPGMPLSSQAHSLRSQEQLQSPMSGEQIMQAMLGNDKHRHTRPLVGQGMMQGGLPCQGMMPVQMQSIAASASTSGRPIVKGLGGASINVTMTTPSQMFNNQPGSTPQQLSLQQLMKSEAAHSQNRPIMGNTATPISSAGIDIAKALQQRQMNISPNPLSHPSVGGSSGTPTGLPVGIPITGRVPLQPAASMSPNPLYMQQVMAQRGISPSVPTVTQMNQLNQLNQLALQAQQQRMIDPRLQGMRGVYPSPLPPGMASRGIPNAGLAVPNASPVAISRALSPLGLGHKPLLNGPMSSGTTGFVNGNNNIAKQGEPNLTKWFGQEVLKNQLPSMPPIPAQGQRVMTVDEIERCQQAVSN